MKSVNVESVAIALMHAYKNTDHEKELGKFLSDNGVKYVSLSASLSPSIKILNRA